MIRYKLILVIISYVFVFLVYCVAWQYRTIFSHDLDVLTSVK